MLKKCFFTIFLIYSMSLFAQDTKKKSSFGEIQPENLISVTIGGEFILNGSYPASQIERLDQFITRIYNEYKLQLLPSLSMPSVRKEALKKIDAFSKRGILLKRRDGENIKIDLEKFRYTGDFSYNPYLKDGDVIIFPAYDLERNFVEIRGAVTKPGKYPYIENDKLSDIIFCAKGISNAYSDVEYAIVSRLSNNGENEEEIKVKITDDFLLKNGDRITVNTNQDYKKDFKVRIYGEVYHPGEIFITKSSTTLGKVIEKAGGFKPNASLVSSLLIRDNSSAESLRLKAYIEKFGDSFTDINVNHYLNLKRQSEMLKIGRLSNMIVEDYPVFNVDNQFRMLDNERKINFTKVIDKESETYNYIVKDGDIIVIPEKEEQIYVWGQIKNAGYYNYKEGQGYNYYINKAGGLTERAESESEIVVIKRNSWNWEKADDTKIEPGDYIYIPKDVPKSIWFYIVKTGTVAGILGSIATIVLLLKQFK